MQSRYPNWDGRIKLLKRDRLPAGLFWATYKQIEEEEHVRFTKENHLEVPDTTELKDWIRSHRDGHVDYRYQNDCVDSILQNIHKGGGLILSATGSGKTRMAAMLASRLQGDVLFVADQLVLLEQAKEDIAKHLGEKVGKVGESEFKPRRVTAATIQTLHAHRNDPKFLRWFSRVDTIILDEIHEMLNRSNFNVVYIARPKLVLGLTATLALSQKPIRLKAYSLCGPVLYEFPLQKGQEAGVLSKGIAVEMQYDNSIREIAAYDSKQAYDERVVENAERNHIISRIIRRAYQKGKYVICLVERLKHLEEISDRIQDIPHRIVAGSFKQVGIPKFDRIRAKRAFEAGKIRVIIASKVFKKGISINRLDVIIDAAGRKSKEDAIQKFGRGVRKHLSKLGLIYIDISDTDRYDKERTKWESRNWMAKAARRRKRALKAVGIPVHTFQWDTDGTAKDLLRKAEKWLLLEMSGEKREIWKSVPSLKNYYEASNLGRVRRHKPGKATHIGRICRLLTWKEGYKTANVSVHGKWTYKLVHRLVMEAFEGPCPEGYQVNHKDGIQGHNWYKNLEYVTPKQNVRHCIANGRFPSRAGEHNGRAKLTEHGVRKIRHLRKRGWSVHRIAKKIGVGDHLVYWVLEGKTWKHVE